MKEFVYPMMQNALPGSRRQPRFASIFWLLVFGIDGCAHVPPYDREKLAHPTMTTEDLARASEDHVRAVQEGAVGGGDATGGGCGCN